MDTVSQMKELVDSLNNYTYYYDKGNPQISDKEWDDLYFTLTEMENESGITLSDSPTQSIPFEKVSELKAVQHNHPMLSLAKTKSEKEVQDFIDNKPFVMMCKMDGLTCSLLYQNGQLVRAETRGNGQVGEEITHNALHVTTIPKTIPCLNDLIIDGEIICTYKDFEPFKEEYRHPRNFAAGSIRLLDAKESAKRNLTFVAWDCITDLTECNTLTSKLFYLQNIGFTVVPYLNPKNIIEGINILKEKAIELGYPIDGMVFKYNDCDYYQSLGATAHHARGGLAYKFYDDAVPVTLRDITYEVSRRGEMTPVAVFAPVKIDGTVISRCSLHNLSVMGNLSGGLESKGDTLWITKRNQIIPNCEDWESNSTNPSDIIYIPTECPYCGQTTSIHLSDSGVQTLFCDNENCSSRLINRINHYASKKGMDIRGLSKATLEKLIDWGWLEKIEDIYSLKNHKQEWEEKSGFGQASVQKILTAIEESRACELSNFIAVLGIPFIGAVAAKELEKQFKTWEKFRVAIDSKYPFSNLNGFGLEMEQAILHFDYGEADTLVRYLIFSEKNDNIIIENESNKKIKNKIFCVTGKLTCFKNRAELTALIEKAEGKVTSSVTTKTDYLINNDVVSNSTKNKTAQKLGVPIISEQEFLEKFLKQ